MTKKEMFEHIKATYPIEEENYTEVISFIDHEIDLLSRKSTGEKKPTAAQLANETFKALILETMEDGKPYTVGDLVKLMDNPELTQNKISALMAQMDDRDGHAGLVLRTTEKRKTYYTKA